MLRALSLVTLLISQSASAQEWICNEMASVRKSNTILSCGVGEGSIEAQARAQALDYAIKEFHQICDESADCKNNEVNNEPLRNSCEQTAAGFRCYRGIRYTITENKKNAAKVSRADLDLLDEQIRLKEEEAALIKEQLTKESRLAQLNQQIETKKFEEEHPPVPQHKGEVYITVSPKTDSKPKNIDFQLGFATNNSFPFTIGLTVSERSTSLGKQYKAGMIGVSFGTFANFQLWRIIFSPFFQGRYEACTVSYNPWSDAYNNGEIKNDSIFSWEGGAALAFDLKRKSASSIQSIGLRASHQSYGVDYLDKENFVSAFITIY